MSPEQLKALIRTVPDFPAKGIQFRDITTLLADGGGLNSAIESMATIARGLNDVRPIEAIAGIEARGFIFGTGLALLLGVGFIPLRKPGKLPVDTISEDYALEYGNARLELDPAIIVAGQNILLVDDLLATGGTAMAGARLLRRAGAICDHALFLIDLPDLGGAKALSGNAIAAHSLMEFAGH